MSDSEGNDKPCTLTLEDGTHFDLNLLSSAKQDYEAKAGNNNDTIFKLNVCRSVVTELWKVDEPEKVGGFLKREGGDHHGDFSIGQVNTNLTLAPTTREPMMFLSHGSACPSNDKEFASTAVKFVCDQTEFGSGQPRLIAALPPGNDACHFFFEWPTHVACPTSQKKELENQHIWAFFGILAVVFVSWFAGQTVYYRVKLGRRGIDQFPFPHFSKPAVQLPSFGQHSQEGGAPRRARWGVFKRRSQRNGYNHLRQDPDEEDRLAASRFSLDDDEENDIGAEVNAWRSPDASAARASDDSQRPTGSVGVHQGLVDL